MDLFRGTAVHGSAFDQYLDLHASSDGSVANGGTVTDFLINGSAAIRAVQTSEFLIVFGDFVSVTLTIVVGVSASKPGDNINPISSGSSSAVADFFDPTMFTGLGPLFDLPDGWTANSPNGCVTDSRFTCAGTSGTTSAPEPATLAILGLVGLGVMRCRRAA